MRFAIVFHFSFSYRAKNTILICFCVCVYEKQSLFPIAFYVFSYQISFYLCANKTIKTMKFYEKEDFSIAEFVQVFNTCYRLLYHNVVAESKDRMWIFDDKILSEDSALVTKFQVYTHDFCSSDREAMAFTMAFQLFEREDNF